MNSLTENRLNSANNNNPNSSATSPTSAPDTTDSITQLNEKIGILRSKLNDPSLKLTKELVLVACTELQTLYKKLLMSDLENGVQRQLENALWTDCFKGPLGYFMKTDKALFHWMIESGVGFYLGFIQDIGINFDVAFIKNSLRNLYCTNSKIRPTWKSMPSRVVVYYIIQNSMIHVGDLFRYRGSFVEALKMYEKSTSVGPSNGHPYNQMGLVQLHIDSKSIESLLSGIYYYVRAVSVANPFSPAQQNLDSLISKVTIVAPKTVEEEYVYNFLLGIRMVESSSEIPTAAYTASLAFIVGKQSLTFHHLFRVIVVALWAFKKEKEKKIGGQGERNALEIIVSIINGMVSGMGLHEDFATSPYIAHLKIILDWTRLNCVELLKDDTFCTKVHFPALCLLLNKLLPIETNYAESTKDLGNVILPEERKLLGYLPITKAYEHAQVVLDERDKKIPRLRIARLLSVMDYIVRHSEFMERAVLTREFKIIAPHPASSSLFKKTLLSLHSVPNKRNVALQSILSQMDVPVTLPTDIKKTPSNDNEFKTSLFAPTSPAQAQQELKKSPLFEDALPAKKFYLEVNSSEGMSGGSSVGSAIGDGRKSRKGSGGSGSVSPTPGYYFTGESNPQTPCNFEGSPPFGSDENQRPDSGLDAGLFTSIWTPFNFSTPEGGWK